MAKNDNQDTWAMLEAGVDRMMNRLTEGLDMITYMKLYTAVHNFCTSQKGANQGAAAAQNLQSKGGGKLCQSQAFVDTRLMASIAHLLGEELYQNLIRYLDKHLQGVYEGAQRTGDDSILSYYIKEWKRYTTAAQYNNHVFRYLNRHWVKREMDEGKKNIYDIYTLHLVRWKEDMFHKTEKDVMAAVLRLVQRQRNGETVEHSQIKSIVDSFGT